MDRVKAGGEKTKLWEDRQTAEIEAERGRLGNKERGAKNTLTSKTAHSLELC